MSRHIALLRGINVGRAKRVAMADLRRLMTDLGYTEVRTLLNSGNVVFDVPAKMKGDPSARLEKALAEELKVASKVLVISATDLAAVAKKHPFGKLADNPSRLMVTFLFERGSHTKLEPLTKQQWEPEALALKRDAAYFWCPAGIIESPLFKAAGKLLGAGATTRNWATVTKLHEMAQEA